MQHLSTHLHDEAAVVFWANIDQPDPMAFYLDCEEWLGAYAGDGEPAHICAGEHVHAALYALLCIGSPQPTDKHQIRRTCNNARCVSNKHLYWANGQL